MNTNRQYGLKSQSVDAHDKKFAISVSKENEKSLSWISFFPKNSWRLYRTEKQYF